MSSDPITLRINGVDWQWWTSMEISRQMDAIAGSFSISLADRWSTADVRPPARALPIAAGMACEVLIGDDAVITGHIDKVTPSISATDHTIQISGRDKSADLVDCSAVHAPGHWLNQNVLQLATILADPFGVPVTAEGDIGAPIASFKLEQGETAFEALDRALKQRELLACPNGTGGLVLLKSGSLGNATALRQGENILSASAEYDMTDRYSQYLVQGQRPGSDDAYGLDVSAVHAANRDPAVLRYRPLIVRAESAVDGAGATQRAAWESTVRAARAVTVTVTVQGFRQGDGSLWRINAITDVDIPYLRLAQRLVVSKATFRRDGSSGSITTLELKDPAAFRPEPQKRQTGTGGGAYTIESEKDLQTRTAENAAKQHQQIKGDV